MENMNWNYPTPIWFGLNRVNEVQIACNNLNIKNPLIVTDPGILKTNIISKVNNSLASEAFIYSDVQGNPTGSNVMNGARAFNVGQHDGVIAVGGDTCLALVQMCAARIGISLYASCTRSRTPGSILSSSRHPLYSVCLCQRDMPAHSRQRRVRVGPPLGNSLCRSLPPWL